MLTGFAMWVLMVVGQPMVGYATQADCQAALAKEPHGACVAVSAQQDVSKCTKDAPCKDIK